MFFNLALTFYLQAFYISGGKVLTLYPRALFEPSFYGIRPDIFVKKSVNVLLNCVATNPSDVKRFAMIMPNRTDTSIAITAGA